MAKDYLLHKTYTLTKRFSWTGYLNPMPYDFFKEEEIRGLKPEFVVKLVSARRKTIELDPAKKGVPFRISSGYRAPSANQSVIGAVPDSAHLKGLAVDLRVYTSREASLIVQACYAAGIDRCGIYVDEFWQPIHIHVDIDPYKITDVLFVKKEKN